MKYEFDSAKDKRNLLLHGLSLEFARELEWSEALVWLDQRFVYDELRMIGLVPKGNRLFYVAFVDRGEEPRLSRRILSLRHAERREIEHYAKNYS